MKKKVFVLASLLVALNFISCTQSSDENLDALLNQVESSKIDEFSIQYDDFKEEVKYVFSKKGDTRAESTLDPSVELSSDDIKDLNYKCLEMFKSEGFEESDFAEFKDSKDLTFVTLGVLYMGFVESNALALKTVKTRSESDEDTCWDTGNITSCFIAAVTGLEITGSVNTVDDIISAFKRAIASARCLTKASALSVARSVIGRFPIVAVGTFVLSFSDCMGWI